MDSFLQSVNRRPHQAISSLFVDDVLLLPELLAHLQESINNAQTWAEEHATVWNIAKSFGLQLPASTTVSGQKLPDRMESTYMGVTFTKKGVTEIKLI